MKRRVHSRHTVLCASLLTAIVTSILVLGCQTHHLCCDRNDVSADLQSRTGQPLGPELGPHVTSMPPDVNLDDGVTEDEAITVALWNNAAYREMLAELGLSHAQLYAAGLLVDPQMTMFFPLGPKQFEMTAFFAIDAVWLRPIRLRAAGLDLANVSRRMVQNGLNLIRDVRVAHANLIFAQRRAALANEAKKLRNDITALAEKRLKAGDISELEYNTIHVESLRADADADRFAQDVVIARNNLKTLLGLTLQNVEPVAVDGLTCPLTNRPVKDLLNEALAMRPDLRAAEIAVQTACERSKVAKWQFMNLDAVYDANSRGIKGFESGPGLRMTIPIFNGNRGNMAIADAQVHQALQRYITVRDQVTLDVRTAYVQAKQANDNLDAIQKRILPKLKTTVDLATKNYRAGGTSYFLVLQTTGQFLDSRARELDLQAAYARAMAELDRSVGRRVSCADTAAAPIPPIPAANTTVSVAKSRNTNTTVVQAAAKPKQSAVRQHDKPATKPALLFPLRSKAVVQASATRQPRMSRDTLSGADGDGWMPKEQ